MKLAFVGIGNVGGTLARQLGKKGHSIYLGARDPQDSDAQKLAKDIGGHAEVLSPQDAVNKADVIFLATPWPATEAIVKSLKNLKGKILIDCTNPLKPDLSGLTVGFESSGGESVQSWAPDAKVVKAFNTTGFNIMANPIVDGRRAVMYYCGNDKEALHTVGGLIEDVGFEGVDAGSLATARLLEPYALLWIASAYKFGLGRDFAFTLARR